MDRKEYHRLYRINNHDKILERERLYRINNKEQIEQRRIERTSKNKNKIKKRSAKRYLRNKEVRKIQKAKWKKTEYGNISDRLSKHKRRKQIKNTSDNTVTVSYIKSLFIKQNNKCIICNKELHNIYHIDHIIPLAK